MPFHNGFTLRCLSLHTDCVFQIRGTSGPSYFSREVSGHYHDTLIWLVKVNHHTSGEVRCKRGFEYYR